jgi:7-cyano-7-deazaguanosine (preQ0) biosynthesis protein QueE
MTVTPVLPPDERASRTTLAVAEIFGPTVQGEGPSAGQVAGFLRLGGCNLSCNWCDAAYTWDARRHDLRAEIARVNIAVIAARLTAMNTPMIVITGGEPLLHQHQRSWRKLIDDLHQARKRIEIETNGTVPPVDHTTHRVDQFNVSPKLAHSGDPEYRRIRPDVLRAFLDTRKAIFKFVCRTVADVDDVAATIAAHDIPHDLTWIMPEGTSTEVLAPTLARVADRAIAHRFNVTARLHIDLWGNGRGR